MTEAEKKPRMTVQEKVEFFFGSVFGRWGEIVAARPKLIFWGFILFFLLIGSGMSMSEGFENEEEVWTPRGNRSLKSQSKARELFPSKGGFIGLLAETKKDTVITLATFKELEKLQEDIKSSTTKNGDKDLAFADMCISVRGSCVLGENPIYFVTDSQGTVNWDQFADDAALLT